MDRFVGRLFRKVGQAFTLALYVNGGIISAFIGGAILLLLANWLFLDWTDDELWAAYLDAWWLFVPIGWIVSLQWLQRNHDKERETIIAILHDEDDWVKL